MSNLTIKAKKFGESFKNISLIRTNW